MTRRLATSALALATVAALALPACGVLGGGGTYRVTAYFDRAVSVFPSSDVRVLGLPAGSVADVTIDGDQVRIDMDIDDGIRIPEGATAQIVPQSLIGERYIQISPAYQTGDATIGDGAVIDRTIIPVEPDEALAALKEFLDSLDPEGIGTLVSNLEEDLRGNGSTLNDALGGLSELVDTFAEKDQALVRIVDSFDRLTSTLATREQQLGEVLDAFGQASQVLADERQSIEDLVAALADLSRNGLALVSEHAGPLREDIAALAGAAATIEANLSSVTQLLASGPILSDGLIGGYNHELRALNLRNNFVPLVGEILDLTGLCEATPELCEAVEGLGSAPATPAHLDPAPGPVGALLDLLGRPTTAPAETGPGVAERTADAVAGAARRLLGVGR